MDHASLPILPQRAQINYSQQAEIIAHLIKRASLTPAARAQISRNATNMVQRIRAEGKPGLIESFLAEYGLSSAEGIALMRLAEALLRVPDAATIDALVTDKIAPGNWASHCGHAASALVNASTLGLWSTGQVLSLQSPSTKQSINRAIQRLGAPVIRLAMTRAMKEMGRQFVLGETIEAALRTSQGMQDAQLHSFDMLGEAACTKSDADRYYTSYRQAIEKIARASNTRNTRENPGISVKLSALHPRYEVAQTARVIAELVPKLQALAIAAKTAAIGLTVDAEEANRLVLSLAVIEQVLATPELAGWDGFGVVVQAYGPRASGVIDHLYNLAKRHDRQIAIRLVKGAYWDSEIKQAQLDGLSGFPVFTAKAATDISYIANVRKLFSMTDRIYPQFATHNAHTIAAILHMAPNHRCFEFQRLHGMGAALHGLIRATHATQCRTYAPVGAHRDLLAYLVRRLLENGANSSFVNQIVDPEIPPEQVAADPFSSFDCEQRPLPLGTALFHPRRQNSRGFDLSDGPTLAAIEQRRGLFHKTQWNSQPLLAGLPCPEHSQICNNPAVPTDVIGQAASASAADIDLALQTATVWKATPVERGEILKRAADLFEKNDGELFALLTREAGKTLPDAVSELRESVDFLRYYAGEINHAPALGLVSCISPWNFPLAIFTGQIAAALAAGNAVLAKPAEQTPLIAYFATCLLHQAGVPRKALQLLPGDGTVGAALTSSARVDGVAFTGSTQTAKNIRVKMAETLTPGAPFIAETGGLNAMIVDSTALPEQAVANIIESAFQSAGQRCSALRCVYVQDDIAPEFIAMLIGAMRQLSLDDPWLLRSDLGPVIDPVAKARISKHIAQAADQNRVLWTQPVPLQGHYVAPTLIRVSGIEALEQEVFGPVLHLATFASHQINAVIEAINNTGYGLTFGLQTRLSNRTRDIAQRIMAGNIYVNRNQIGAVVGSQPFGGHGLSGTGPKAGGPFYLNRFHAVGQQNTSHSWDHIMSQTALTATMKTAATGLQSPDSFLPGPTGELNARSTFAKPPILCAGPGKKAAETQAKAVTALGGVAVKATGQIRAEHLTDLTRLGAVIWWGDGPTARMFDLALAARAGPIVALITGQPDSAHVLFEQHECIDTTAAGGNATLLRGDS